MSSAVTALPHPTSPVHGPLRPFGAERQDLDFDFATTERFALAAHILAACTAPRHERPALAAAILELPVGARIARLLRVVAATEQADALTVPLTCSSGRCASGFEVHLPYDHLLDTARTPAANAAVEVRLPRGTLLRMRHPTGRDQQAWRTQSFGTPYDAVRGIVQTLATVNTGSMTLDDQDIATLADAMEEVDPLTAFRVVTTCPQCGVEATMAVDLEAESLRRLELAQRALLRDVHTLASRYGWTETEVAAVPPSRRARYVRLIEALEEVPS